MGANTNSTNSKYESAAKKYQALQKQYTGNEGYQNSIKQAQQGATIESRAQAGQVREAAINSGMGKGSAGLLAGNAAANAYNQNFSNQQAKAYNAGTDALNSQGQYMSSQQTEGQNRYNRAWGNVGAYTGMAGSVLGGLSSISGSDERTKDAVNLTSGCKRNCSKQLEDAGKVLDKHRTKDYKELLVKSIV